MWKGAVMLNLIDLEERDFDKVCKSSSFLGSNCSEKDFKYFITKSSYVRLEGNKPIVYIADPLLDLELLLPHLDQQVFNQTTRHKGKSKGQTFLFGATSGTVNKTGICGFGAIQLKDARLNDLLVNHISRKMMHHLNAHMNGWEQVNQKLRKKSSIHEDYFMADTFWTSGILNKNNPSPYHYDGMNQPHMISAMFTLKRKISGGFLVFPEYELAFEVTNRSIIFFCGRDILHGVSPINIKHGGARYTVVYYTTASLKHCASYKEELLKAGI